jgi:hypothetical protein
VQTKIPFFVLFVGLILSACATQTGWTPKADSNADQIKTNVKKDKIECEGLAEQASDEAEAEAGGVRMEVRANKNYEYFFRNCMINRGHEVLD